MTVKDIIIKTTAVLKDAGIESASLDCRLLLCKFLGVDKVYLITNSDREVDDLSGFDALVKRRLNHEPMQYILNHAEFMGLDFYVDENVLIAISRQFAKNNCTYTEQSKNQSCYIVVFFM